MKTDFIKSVKGILELPEEQRHREYLKLFSGQGLRFNVMLNGIAENEWQENYTDRKFEPRINLIERLSHILVVEFDEPEGEGMKPSEALEETEKRIKKNGWGYLRSSHKGKSDYLWLEFSQPIADSEAERFLKWICPKKARIDTNFSSSVRVFPVLFATHRKHSANIEEVLYIKEGKKINFSKLKIPQSIQGESKSENKQGYDYKTFQKEKAFEDSDFKRLCDNKEGLNKYYEQIISILREYMDLSEPSYAVISTWIIGTYLHKQFSSYPYLFFNAMKGSGKSRILKIIANLSRNGSVAGSMTEAVLFRTAKERTLCIDEFENMNAKGNENLKLLLNSAYKKGMAVERMNKNKEGKQIPEKFEVYCPITMANIWGMDNVLADRCISVILEKSSKEQITKLVENFEDNPRFLAVKNGLTELTKKIGDNLNLFGNIFNEWNSYVQNKVNVSLVNSVSKVNNVSNVSENTDNTYKKYDTYDLFLNIDKTDLSGRDLELFFPLFITANLFSKRVLNSLLETSRLITNERKETDREENKDIKLIEFLAQAEYKEDSFLNVSDIKRDIGEYYEEPEEWHDRGISRALKRLGLLQARNSTGKKRQVKVYIEKAKEKLLMFKETSIPSISQKKEELFAETQEVCAFCGNEHTAFNNGEYWFCSVDCANRHKEIK